ncbi:serine/threonine protein kinase and WD40 domain protein [Metarhizium robertsii]|uniref:non-specific serine/threonine protein kinase n=2 Tax=Metarhizium robertsii TaxID=568076 RepID=E9EN15_METRA|nr:vacuolar sorting protein [Metarhizium robertsii ARSEF 23]EFZ04079.1 vacuolar sorting protein [Metarhizium robertsii ARSEF 23]EXV00951.1 serine/threonine protein kinase and WD40 domain protein [Metarhizium robertsii]
MGQGFSLATPSAGSAGIDIAQLQDVQYERSIGNARFMKSIRGRHEHGVVLVKVLVKPYAGVNLDQYKQKIIKERKALAQVPNALGFQRIIETDTNGYLVRQFQYSSLYDRLSTRPFLEDIEKKWLAFQLLCALRDCHAHDVYHGDIKAQNVLVTSWNWLYLTDFSSAYKPVLLPDDNPGDFSYFFDTSGRRTCYIAPERFYATGDSPPPKAKMTWAMDIFSAGCVIAQMFLESEIFSLAQLYKYRRGEYDPVITHLSVISDKDVRDMIAHMIQIDPEKRYSAEQYLEFWKGKVFPSYFYNFLHQYMELITDPSSGNNPMSGSQRNMGESDDRIDRVFYDFDKISYFLGYQIEKRTPKATLYRSRLSLSHFPVRLSIPNHEHTVSADLEPPEDDGTLIFLTLIVSSMRTTARASSRVRACDILLAFSERLTDEAKLDRVLPYLMTLLKKEETDSVIVAAIRTITQLLQLVRMPTPINSHVLVEYVLPRLEIALGSRSRVASSLVRATYASCIGSLASTAQRFLEIASSLRADGSMPITDPEVEPGAEAEANFESVFDNAGRELFEILESHTKQLVEDPDVHVRRAFLASVAELCMFFQEHSNDILLTHLNTYLNDHDWTLKCSFFDTIVGIAAFIGSTSLEEFMLPLMVQALADTEEYVVQAALHSLAQLAGLGLLSRPKTWELVDLVGRFTMHPNIWIREAAAEFLSQSAKFLNVADVRCILLPLVVPYMKIDTMADLGELSILDSLKRPLTRAVFEQAITWALQSERGVFWKPLQKIQSRAFGSSSARPFSDLSTNSMTKIVRNDEDEQWLSRLRNLGLKPDDEPKLLALREFIWRLSRSKLRDSAGEPSLHTGLVSLKELGITPQTVFFNDTPLRDSSITPDLDTPAGPYTIADALLDASMTIDDTLSKRRKAVLHTRVNRVQSVGPRPSPKRRFLSPEGSTRASSQHSRRESSDGRPGGARDDDVFIRDGPYASRRAMRHQSSALSLLDRRDGNKSAAETSTSDANAFGEVEGPFAQGSASTSPTPTRQHEGGKLVLSQARHTYEGTDPNIQRMLDQMYIDNFPRDVLEFGPMVQPISRTKARAVGIQPGDDYWKPEGHLVATFGEHKGPINRIVASPDHVFFITGGNDGCVRVWDAARLERNITHRSRQTHKHADGAHVLAMCFVENSHCFVSCASDGSMHVVKVDTISASGVIRYGKLRVVREYQLPEGEFAVWCEHFRQESNSVLVLATNRSRILGIDLRTMSVLYVLENPVHHGAPTCFCVDRKRNWLCLGTSHGVVDLWDLRFKMRLRGWGVPGKGSIYRICIHPTKGRGKWVCISGGTSQGEITVWDLEKTLCREIYRTSGNKDGPKGYSAWDVDEDKPEGMLDRFATNLENSEAASADRGVRAMIAGTGAAEDSRDIRHAFLLTGGSDKKLRFWDISRIENSCIYSGQPSDEQQPTFIATHPATAVTLNIEKAHRHGSSGNTTAAGERPRGKSSSKRPARSTVISMQQQQLLQSHLDAILDVMLLEYPYTMSVSVDRSGVVFVFQ